MSKENLTMFEQVIDSEKGEEREFYLKGLKDMIGKLEKDADEDLKKEIGRLKTKFSIGGAKKSPAPKKSPAKKTTAKRTTKPKTTKEEREKKKAEVKDATGKTIEECKEILAKYEAMRLKTNKEQKERVSELKKKDEIIDGTNVKTADATTKTTAKEVAPKIKKEVEQIEKEAEREAKKVVKPQGKTATEVKKQVEKKKEEIIEKKVEDMTEDLISATTKFIESVSDEIGRFKKDDQKKFLINLRKEIDVLLRDYGYGGELGAGVQAYEVPWMGGKPSMYSKGGEVDSDIVKAIFEPNEMSGQIQTSRGKKSIEGLSDMISNTQFDSETIAKSIFTINSSNGKIETNYGKKTLKGLENMILSARESAGINFAKGGSTKSVIVDKQLGYDIFVTNTNNPNKDNREFVALVKGKGDALLMVSALNNSVKEAPLHYFMEDNFSNRLKGKKFAKGGKVLSAIAEDWGRDSDVYYAVQDSYVAYDSDEKAKEVLEEYDMLEDYEHLFAKGGKTRSLRSIRKDRARLSQEPWEQAYKSKRKGNYYAKGGVTASSDIIDIAIYWLDENEPLQGENYSINSRELSKKLKSGKRDKQTIEELMDMLYSNGQNDDTAIELDGYSVAVYGEEGVDDYIRGEDIYYAIDEDKFAKGGNVENSFSRKAEARGLDTEDFMNQVLHNPSYYDERTRRQAQFMKNEFNM
jgi:hypothetical protein